MSYRSSILITINKEINISSINRCLRGKTVRVASGRGGNAARGVVAQMLRPERVLVIFCLKAEDSEGFDSTVVQTLYQSLDWNIFGDNLSFIGG